MKIKNYYNGHDALYKTVTKTKINEEEIIESHVNPSENPLTEGDPNDFVGEIISSSIWRNGMIDALDTIDGEVMKKLYYLKDGDKVKCYINGTEKPVVKFSVLKNRITNRELDVYSNFKKFRSNLNGDDIYTRSVLSDMVKNGIRRVIQVIEVIKNDVKTYNILIEFEADKMFTFTYKFEDINLDENTYLTGIVMSALSYDDGTGYIFGNIEEDIVKNIIENYKKTSVSFVMNDYQNNLHLRYHRYKNESNHLKGITMFSPVVEMSVNIDDKDLESLIENFYIDEVEDPYILINRAINYSIKDTEGNDVYPVKKYVDDWQDAVNKFSKVEEPKTEE